MLSRQINVDFIRINPFKWRRSVSFEMTFKFFMGVYLSCLVSVADLGAAESSPFQIDTSTATEEALSSGFVINTRGDVSGGGESSSFVIDTREEGKSLAVSPRFTIDTREDNEKLDYKYQLWAAANAPEGQRGMEDVTERFGVSNLLAFALGWEANDASTWFRARVQSVEMSGNSPGVWLRVHRRTDLPELIWTWTQSSDLQSFTNAPALLDQVSSPLGGVMEQWDVRVPLPNPESQIKSFYRLEVKLPQP